MIFIQLRTHTSVFKNSKEILTKKEKSNFDHFDPGNTHTQWYLDDMRTHALLTI